MEGGPAAGELEPAAAGDGCHWLPPVEDLRASSFISGAGVVIVACHVAPLGGVLCGRRRNRAAMCAAGYWDDLCSVGQMVMWAIMEPPDLRLGAGQCIDLPCRMFSAGKYSGHTSMCLVCRLWTLSSTGLIKPDQS